MPMPTAPKPLTIATFNVKDLFDARGDDPGGRARLEAKLAWLAERVARLDADVLALQEVGSAQVLEALCARLPAPLPRYEPAVVGTADARGIRCALLARVPLLASRVHTADHLSFPTFYDVDPPPFGARIPLRRGVVHARVDGGALGAIDLLVAHFKSNRPVGLKDARGVERPPTSGRAAAEGHLRSLVWRAAEALFVRGLVDALLEADPTRHVVVAGDLNDLPESVVVRILAGEAANGAAGATAAPPLLPCADAVPPARRYSILRHGAPQQIDHVLVTQGLRGRLQSARFCNEELRDHGELAEDEPPTVDSDHAPLVVSFA